MAQQVTWTLRAQADRKQILDYWRKRNGSNIYSIKLNALFKETVALIRKHPKIGRPSNDKNVRIKVVKDYLIFYEIANHKIYILTVWDNRQDPEKLKKIFS